MILFFKFLLTYVFQCLEITNIVIQQLDESNSQNVQCNLKNGEKVLKDEVTTRNEKICVPNDVSKQELKESKLTFECNLASSAKNEDDNESKNMQKLCFMARINFYGTNGESFVLI